VCAWTSRSSSHRPRVERRHAVVRRLAARKSEVVFDFIVEDRLLAPAEYTPTSPPATSLEPCQVVAAVV
jgi:hypothetical protein